MSPEELFPWVAMFTIGLVVMFGVGAWAILGIVRQREWKYGTREERAERRLSEDRDKRRDEESR